MFDLKLTKLALELMQENIGLNFIPYRATPLSAGYDLKYCGKEVIDIYPNEVKKIGTGICLYVGSNRKHNSSILASFILPRSSSNGLILENTVGLVDADYQGEIFIKLKNTSTELRSVSPGDRIAQLVIMNCFIPNFNLVNDFDHTTCRADGSDGSTGK